MAQAATPACPNPATGTSRTGSGQVLGTPGDTLAIRAGTARDEPVDIAIIASASAREIRFARTPEIRVRLCGGLDSVRVIERRNLPERIVAGQTYRDVYIAVEILGRVDAACLARRLGVAPASDTVSVTAADAGECAAVTIGRAAAPAATAPAPTGAPVRSPPGMEDAPGRAQVTPVRP